MPAAETFLALSALGPALFKSSIPATAALSASGAASLPTTAPTAGFAAVSAAGGGAGMKSLCTALLLTKKGGATIIAKAGSGFFSMTKGATPAAGANSAVGGSAAPFSTATPPPPVSGHFAPYPPSHVGASAPLHHPSPFHGHPGAVGTSPGARSIPSPNAPPLDRLPTQHVHHNHNGVTGGEAGKNMPPEKSLGNHRSWHHSGTRGTNTASNSHSRATRPQATRTGHEQNPNKGEGHSNSRRSGGVSSMSAPSTDSTAPAEQADVAPQPAGDAGGGSHEMTVISTLVGVALLRWAVSSLCFGRSMQESETPATEEIATTHLGSSKKYLLEGRELGIAVGKNSRKRQTCQCTGRRVERWKRDEELFLDDEYDFDRITLLSKLSEKVEQTPPSSSEVVDLKPTILEVCLSDNEEGDGLVVAQGEAVETSEEYKKEWPFTGARNAPDQLLDDVTTWELEQERYEEERVGNVESFSEKLGAGQPRKVSRDGLEDTSDTTIASSRFINEICSTSEETTKKHDSSALHEAFCRPRSTGRMAAFL